MWYFCYGANMSSQVLVDRRGVKPISSESARLKGHQLVFTQPGIPIIEPAFANLIANEHHDVFGVLHNLTANCLSTIDSFEGPEYERLKIEIHRNQGNSVNTWINRARFPQVGLKPSKRYLQLILDGAKEFDLPPTYIDDLYNTETGTEFPLITPILPTLINLTEKIASRNTIVRKIGYGLLKLLARLHR